MTYSIERIDESNYPFFDDMLFWRESGEERAHVAFPIPEAVICLRGIYMEKVLQSGERTV